MCFETPDVLSAIVLAERIDLIDQECERRGESKASSSSPECRVFVAQHHCSVLCVSDVIASDALSSRYDRWAFGASVSNMIAI